MFNQLKSLCLIIIYAGISQIRIFENFWDLFKISYLRNLSGKFQKFYRFSGSW